MILIFTGIYRRVVALILVLFLAFDFSAQQPYVVGPNGAPRVNIRTDPSTKALVLDCLTPGTRVTVFGNVPFWREVSFGFPVKRGWIAKKFLQPAESISPAPQLDSAPYLAPHAILTIHFIDVGQGDAIWIQTHDDGVEGNGIFEGRSILIDGGPYSADHSNPVLPYLEERGHHGAEIEAIIVTHPHIDHFSGAETISRHFSINHYYDPGYPSSMHSYKNFLAAMQQRAKRMHIGKANFGDLNWGNELKAEILYAWDEDSRENLGDGNTVVNNASIVLRIEYGDHVFLFMGDAEGKDRDDPSDEAQYVEKILLSTVPAKLKATVLKVAHHGSETSSTIPFIEAVDPDVVIAQSGRKSFGGTFLPDRSTLERYCSHNNHVKIYRTDQDDEAAGHDSRGAVDNDHIIVRSNGYGQVQIEAMEGGRPFRGNFCENE